MGYEFNQKELEAALSKSVIVLQLRDILTKTGIPSDETVTLRIQQGDESIVSVEVPEKSPEIMIPQLATNFAEEIDNFLNRAEALTGLISALLPKSDLFPDGSTKIPFKFIFDIGTIVARDIDNQNMPRQQTNQNMPRQQTNQNMPRQQNVVVTGFCLIPFPHACNHG